MKNKQVIHFQMPRQRTRAHAVLFDNDSPFKQKVVKSKKAYTRRPKYVKTQFDDLGD